MQQIPSIASQQVQTSILQPLPQDEQLISSSSWQLLSSLVSALEIDDLLQRFFKHLHSLNMCQAVHYRHEELDLTAEFGIPGRCQMNYRLMIPGTSMGELTLSRRRRFSDEGQRALEQAIGLLIHPLHNVIRFQQMRLSALRDPLTRLQNRMAMGDYLDQEIALLVRYREAFSLIMLDVDNFKQINDVHGHSAGDQVLRMLALRLKETCRNSDAIFRIGGDEFVIAMPRASRDNARCTAERLCTAVSSAPFIHQDTSIKVGVSLGLASYQPGESISQLMERADAALYQAKAKGRNRFKVSEEEGTKLTTPSICQ